MPESPTAQTAAVSRAAVGILGPLVVTVDGAQVAAGGPRQRSVLALLAAHVGQVVSVDSLAEALWGADALHRSRGTLQVYISNLRAVLGSAAAIVARPPGYVLDPAVVSVDAAVFRADLAAAQAATDVAQRAVLLRQALSLWRGEVLADLGTSEGFTEIAAHLADLRTGAVEARFEAELDLGNCEALIPELEAACRAQPLREKLWGQLMLALYRVGRQADALSSYRRAREMLADELGIDPGPALRRLEQSILEQSGSLDVADPTSSSLMWWDAGGRLRRLTLTEPTQVSIGRAKSCVISLDWDEHVSRMHARLDYAGGWVLADTGSSNGTWHNGRAVRDAARLSDGDQIRCGDTYIFVRLAGPVTARRDLGKSERTVRAR